MLFQFSFVQEIKFLNVLLIVILGWQASFLFFYNYYKIRDENVKLNRILLSYGFLVFMLMLSLLLLSIITLLLGSPENAWLLRKLAYSSTIGAFAFFWFYVGGDQFSEIFNPLLAKLFMGISLIFIFILMFLGTISAELQFLLVILGFEGFFMILFQVKMILRASGTLKKRFILITVSGFLMAISLGLGAESEINMFPFTSNISDSLFFSSIGLLFLAVLILFMALYNFPPILEFKWKENLLKLVIFNNATQTSLYSYVFPKQEQFSGSKSERELSQSDSVNLFSGGIIGIDGIISAITNTKGEKLNRIKQGNSYILLEYGTQYEKLPLTYALVVNEDLKSIRYFLTSIKNQFESFYKEILFDEKVKQGSAGQLFQSFEIIIKDLLVLG